MDVLVLIDKLDDLIHNARPVPLTDQVRVDREEIYDLLDQMRATIPEEIIDLLAIHSHLVGQWDRPGVVDQVVEFVDEDENVHIQAGSLRVSRGIPS